MAQVEPKACFKKLKGVSASKLIELSPVKPLVSISKEDKRFVEGYAVVDAIDHRTNLAAMDWLDFENLIREVFEKEFSKGGGEVKITQASRDGGVDAVAFDPDPIRGGKVVIQAKRYTNTVGVGAVRDLYGTVHNEGANKSILDSARQPMGYCGVVPSEDSSGKRTRRGGITKTGNAHLRRIVVEAAWSYRRPPGIWYGLRRRQESISEETKEIAWKAQHRLHKRYVKLGAAGKDQRKIVTAVAREPLGFIWAIGTRAETVSRQQVAA